MANFQLRNKPMIVIDSNISKQLICHIYGLINYASLNTSCTLWNSDRIGSDLRKRIVFVLWKKVALKKNSLQFRILYFALNIK